jgi:hypothetical protein
VQFRTKLEEKHMFKNVKLMAVAAVAAVLPVSVFAAVDAAVTTALTTAGTDAATVGAAVLVIIVGIYAFKLLRKAL